MGVAFEAFERRAFERGIDELAPIRLRRGGKIAGRSGSLGVRHNRKMPRVGVAANRSENPSARRLCLPRWQLLDAPDVRAGERIANASSGDDAIGCNFRKRQENKTAFEQPWVRQRQIRLA